MRVLVASHPAFGHVYALMPLTLALRHAGHDVTFATGADFVAKIRSWGFEARRVGESLQWAWNETAREFPELVETTHGESPELGGTMFVDVLASRILEEIPTVIEAVRPDVVVYEATDVGAGVAAAGRGIPVACHALSVWSRVFRDALLRHIPRLWSRAPTEPRLDVTVGDAFLDLWPQSLQDPEADAVAPGRWPIRPVPWSDPASEVPEFVTQRRRRPLVFVSLGTMFWGKELLRAIVAGLSTLDVDALVLAGADATPQDFDVATDRIHVAGFVNQAKVLGHADVVIHHGGAGTMLGSLTHGLPQLVLPEGADRPATAATLAAAGAGVVIEPRKATPSLVAEGVDALLRAREYRDRAVRLREEIASMPAPTEVVPRLEALAAAGAGGLGD